jgi:hypothetical protein
MKFYKDWPVPVGDVVVNADEVTLIHSATPGGFRVEDLEEIPDRRVELLDGVIAVRPPITPLQRRWLNDAGAELSRRCPPGTEPVVGEGASVRDGERTLLRPDLGLARRGDGSPLMSVGVRPDPDQSVRQHERWFRLVAYARIGIESVWFVNDRTGAVTAYDLRLTRRQRTFSGLVQACAMAHEYGWGPWRRRVLPCECRTCQSRDQSL